MEKKITKRENFGAIVEILRTNGYEEYAQVMEHEISLLNRKRTSGKMTEKQIENEGIKDKIMEIVTAFGDGMTVTEILGTGNMNVYTMNKMVALVTQLKNENRLIRYEIKGVAKFRLPQYEGEVNEVKEK